MEDYQQRVVDEKKELDKKLGKLSTFMNSGVRFTLDAQEQGLLMVQLVAMENYSHVLGIRIELFE